MAHEPHAMALAVRDLEFTQKILLYGVAIIAFLVWLMLMSAGSRDYR